MPTITKKQLEEYEQLRCDRDNGRLLTPDGLWIICAAFENDLEKISIPCWRRWQSSGMRVS